MEIEVFFGRFARSIRCCDAGEWGRCRHHEKRERLGAGWSQRFLLAIFDVIGTDAIDGIQQLGILRRRSAAVQQLVEVDHQAYIVPRRHARRLIST